MSEICANLLKIAIIKFMQIIFMRFQHESTVTENASSGAVNLNRRQSAPFERQRTFASSVARTPIPVSSGVGRVEDGLKNRRIDIAVTDLTRVINLGPHRSKNVRRTLIMRHLCASHNAHKLNPRINNHSYGTKVCISVYM